MVDPTVVAEEVYSMRDARQMPRRVLIVRLGAMGDVLHALPAVHLLRQAIPRCEIGWAIEKRWLPLLCAHGFEMSGDTTPQRPLVNSIHVFDTRAWRKSVFSAHTWSEVRGAISDIRLHRYEVAIDMQGAIKSAVLGAFSGADSLIGFRRPREAAARILYSHSVDATLPHVIEQNFELVRRVAGDALETPRTLLPLDPAAEQWATEELAKRALTKFVLLSPSAGWAAKEWPAQNFGAVARELSALGFSALINFGPGEEPIAEAVRSASGGIAIPIACTLPQLIAITRRASLFIGGDTGPMHLAAALQVPVVALFGPTDPTRNGPYSPRARVLRSPQSATSYRHTSARDAGLATITVQQVLDAATSLLK